MNSGFETGGADGLFCTIEGDIVGERVGEFVGSAEGSVVGSAVGSVDGTDTLDVAKSVVQNPGKTN